MKHTLAVLWLFAATSSLSLAAVPPTDNPAATRYADSGYPAWTDAIVWDNVLDVTSDTRLGGAFAVADDESKGLHNFEVFETARDILYAEGGGVIFFPAGTYHLSLPDMGYGPGIGPTSRGLMLKDGVVLRGDLPQGSEAVIRGSNRLDVTYDLEPTTRLVFPFQKRGTVPPNATGVGGEAAGTPNAAGWVPSDWSFVGITPGTHETDIKDVDNVGVVDITLEGGIVVFGGSSVWGTSLGTSKWKGTSAKVDWPAGSAAKSEDWFSRVPNGEHYIDLINGRAGWHQDTYAGRGRIVLNVKIVDGAPFNDMLYTDSGTSANTQVAVDAFAHYRFAGRIVAYGSDIFLANNVIARPTRNFVHVAVQDVDPKSPVVKEERVILFDYANHIGVDVNKSAIGGNQNNETAHAIDGDGYYAANVVVRDNWIFNRGNKGYEISGHYVVIDNNHNERYHAANTFPYDYIANPDAYPSATAQTGINAGGISFDGWAWQATESASDYMSRGYDLSGMDLWVNESTVINTGSRGNDGEGILGQRHNAVEVLGWAVTRSENGNRNRGPGTLGESGYIGAYDMHVVGFFLMHNRSPGAIGVLKPAANYILDATWADNSGGQDTPGSTHSDDWLAPGKPAAPHTDPVSAPILSAERATDGRSIVLTWDDTADNELGFRVERRISGGDWQVIAYRPRASANGVAAYPGLSIPSVGYTLPFTVDAVVHTRWADFMAPTDADVEYRVAAINLNDDDSTGLSNVVAFTAPVDLYAEIFPDPVDAAGWTWSDYLGWSHPAHYPQVFRAGEGWCTVDAGGSAPGGVWYYDHGADLGWVFSPGVAPYAMPMRMGEWAWSPASGAPRTFYGIESAEWILWPPAP